MENYEVLEPLNAGSFGKVSKIRRKSDNKILVWKELYYGNMSEKEKQQLVAEVNILRELRHPNIVRYYDRIIDKQNQKIWIVMEYCENGDISQLIKKCKREKEYLPEEMIWNYFMQIILALHEIHRRKDGKILHRDIKPANIFLDANNNAKLGDFGLSKILTDANGFAYTTVGTPYYMSPEQLNDKKYNEKSDIWACGCLLYEMCALNRPFEAANHLSLAIKIKSGKFERIPKIYSDELQRVIQWILTRDVNERPSVDELLNIPQISMRLRDKRLKETRAAIAKKEDELKRRIKELEELEMALKNRESELLYREAKLHEQERALQIAESNLKTAPNTTEREHTLGDRDVPKLKLTTHKYTTSSVTETSTDRTHYIDKGYNTSSTETGFYHAPKLSRAASRTEDSTVGGETYINYEINNILRNMDRIVAQTKGMKDGDSPKMDRMDSVPSITKEFSRKNSSKVL
mgnify:CR=1 FL=1